MHDAYYTSFLLRLWRVDEGAPSHGWCGEIEHIQSGTCHSFETLDAAFLWLRRALAATRPTDTLPPLPPSSQE